MSEAFRYPIGRFEAPPSVSFEDRRTWIQQIAELPSLLRRAVEGLDPEQLDTPYRNGGWTVRQVVHHLPDSHMNAYVRFRWALTEEAPLIKPYLETKWADLPDARSAPIDLSLALLDALHERWVYLMRAMSEEDWARRYEHPEGGTMPLTRVLAMYAWHGRHHVAHITRLRERKAWGGPPERNRG